MHVYMWLFICIYRWYAFMDLCLLMCMCKVLPTDMYVKIYISIIAWLLICMHRLRPVYWLVAYHFHVVVWRQLHSQCVNLFNTFIHSYYYFTDHSDFYPLADDHQHSSPGWGADTYRCRLWRVLAIIQACFHQWS